MTVTKPMITTTSENLDIDRTVINHTKDPSHHPQAYCSNAYQSSIPSNDLDCVVNDFLSSQHNNNSILLCSNNQLSVNIREFKCYPVEEQRQNQQNPIVNANDSNLISNSYNSSLFCRADKNAGTDPSATYAVDDSTNNNFYSRILHQWIGHLTQQEQQRLLHSSNIS